MRSVPPCDSGWVRPLVTLPRPWLRSETHPLPRGGTDLIGPRNHELVLLPSVNIRRLNVQRNELPVDQVLHGDWSFKNSRFDRHVIDALQVFIGWRQHAITYSIRRLGQNIAEDFLILPEIRRHYSCRLQAMTLSPFTALGDAAHKIPHNLGPFANQF